LLALATASGSAYYLIRILLGDELAVQANVSFVPSLLFQRFYWEGWLESVSWAVGIVPLVVGILGVATLRSGPGRSFLIGLWSGYIVFCLLFTYHITFAGHYHLLLTPIVAISCAPLVLSNFVGAIRGSWLAKGLCVIAVLLTMVTTLLGISRTFRAAGTLEPPRVAATVGNIVQHSTRTVFLSPFYGAPLEYYGELAGEWWPRQREQLGRGPETERSVSERFRALGFEPEYFIITDFVALRSYEQDLEAFLEHCTLLADSSEYLIYHLQDCLQRP
jgi:hypothetical protein